MTSWRTETVSVTRGRKLNHSIFDCCCSHRSVASTSLALMSGLTLDISSIFCGLLGFSVLS